MEFREIKSHNILPFFLLVFTPKIIEFNSSPKQGIHTKVSMAEDLPTVLEQGKWRIKGKFLTTSRRLPEIHFNVEVVHFHYVRVVSPIFRFISGT